MSVRFHVTKVARMDLTEQEARAFVGPNADYYCKHWFSGGTGFNWAAFLLCGLWLPYRKMYVATTILYVAILSTAVACEIVFEVVLKRPEPPGVSHGISVTLG